ncbi:hypothetical protein [Haematobacter sp. UBA3484]|uniref:hypothetical protein n=1 Tax=Haematobacter sp. UBA3484 TaxID=1946582 RepID=UPI0025BF5A52|nr:hypothetical protein [Haematobacter sp. UBA3484]
MEPDDIIMDGEVAVVAAPEPAPVEILSRLVQEQNIATVLSDERLRRIADDVVTDYDVDRDSMCDWLERMDRGIKLASLVKEDKSYPWPKASNVKYPLITTAALQFNARAYPAIVPSGDAVSVKTFGRDPQGMKAARADRVSKHMSWQLSSDIEEWEEETDKLLVQLPIVGTVVRKVWFDPAYGRIRVRLIPAGNFVVNDHVTTLDNAPRISELIPLYPSEIKERVNSGLYRDATYTPDDQQDVSGPANFIEQHCRLDLDGDGYGEPYIVTVHKETRAVARIVADFDADDVRPTQDGGVLAIKRGSYFVPYHFLPSMDGGFFGTGLGLLLGDISESVNSIINMMMDAGHMASLGGGWIGQELRLKGGSNRFQPGEWKQIPATGNDVRAAVVPMTFPGPDATLFQLLGLLIEAGREVASVKDIMTGDTGGKQQTATTTLALIEQGMMVFSASYKRIYRSLKQEFRMMCRINAATVSPQQYMQFHDEQCDPQMDYHLADMDIAPVADPRSVTKMQETAKAQVVMQMADAGLVDRQEGARRILEATSIPDVEALLPKPDPMQQQIAQMQMQAGMADIALKLADVQSKIADIEATKAKAVKDLTDAAATAAQIQLDAQLIYLNAVKDGLGQALQRGLGGMAPAPGLPPPAGMPGGGAPAPAGLADPGLLGGQPGPGFAAAGFAA